MMFTEMVSAEGLIRNSGKTHQYMNFTGEERPIGIQIFGHNPDSMAEAARVAETRSPELIDLNFGCPAKKVVNGGSGAAVLKDLRLLKTIVRAVTGAVSVPVSCKIRSGWNEDSLVAVEAAKIIEGEGAGLITLHPRTRVQGFSGQSDWRLITEVKKAVSIPVIGNGDIHSPEDARYMLSETGCDAVMVGRAVMGAPWICRHTDHYLETGRLLPQPSSEERIRICIQHYDLSLEILGERRGLKEMRKHIGWYLKGMRNVSRVRAMLMVMEDPDQVKTILKQYAVSLSREDPDYAM